MVDSEAEGAMGLIFLCIKNKFGLHKINIEIAFFHVFYLLFIEVKRGIFAGGRISHERTRVYKNSSKPT